jgi:hypothetical protein
MAKASVHIGMWRSRKRPIPFQLELISKADTFDIV